MPNYVVYNVQTLTALYSYWDENPRPIEVTNQAVTSIPKGWDPDWVDISYNGQEYIPLQKQEWIINQINMGWLMVRQRRNYLLKESDWTQHLDVSLSENIKQQWKIYRQQLRDVTLSDNPFNIVFPLPPI